MTSQTQRLRGSARVLWVIDQLGLADVVKLALSSRPNTASAWREPLKKPQSPLLTGQPHLVVVDMDAAASSVLKRLADVTQGGGASRSSP